VSSPRSRQRSALAQPRITAAAAISSGMPASVMHSTAEVSVLASTTANSSGPNRAT
jgi:hypothetical protein